MSLRDAEMHTRLANAEGETKKIDSPTVEWLYPTQNGSPHRSGAPESNFGKKRSDFFPLLTPYREREHLQERCSGAGLIHQKRRALRAKERAKMPIACAIRGE